MSMNEEGPPATGAVLTNETSGRHVHRLLYTKTFNSPTSQIRPVVFPYLTQGIDWRSRVSTRELCVTPRSSTLDLPFLWRSSLIDVWLSPCYSDVTDKDQLSGTGRSTTMSGDPECLHSKDANFR